MSNEATITEAEVHAFAAKLDEWGEHPFREGAGDAPHPLVQRHHR